MKTMMKVEDVNSQGIEIESEKMGLTEIELLATDGAALTRSGFAGNGTDLDLLSAGFRWMEKLDDRIIETLDGKHKASKKDNHARDCGDHAFYAFPKGFLRAHYFALSCGLTIPAASAMANVEKTPRAKMRVSGIRAVSIMNSTSPSRP